MGFNQIEQIIVLQFTLRTRELLMLHSYAGFQAQRAMHWSRISCLPKNVIVSSFSYRFCWLLHHMCVFRLEARTKWKSLISATLLKKKKCPETSNSFDLLLADFAEHDLQPFFFFFLVVWPSDHRKSLPLPDFTVLRVAKTEQCWVVVWEKEGGKKKTCGIMTCGINNLEIDWSLCSALM